MPTHRRLAPYLAGLLAAGAVAVVGFTASASGGIVPPPADPAPPAVTEAIARDLGLDRAGVRDRLRAEADARLVAERIQPLAEVTGVWFDEATGRLVAGVGDDATADRVRAAGAVPYRLTHSRRDTVRTLKAVAAQAAGRAGVAGWGVDVRTGVVEVRLTGDGRDAFARALRRLGPAVRIVTGAPPQRQQADVRGGDKWVPGAESPCSIGFSTVDGSGARGYVTAGHCTNDANQAAYGVDGTRVGTSNVGGTHSVNAREGDFGLVAVTATGWNLTPTVNAYGTAADVTVSGATDPVVGMSICRSGQTSGWRCGRVTAVDQTIDYGTVVIDGLFTTDACSQGGDSGGSYVTGALAVGIHSGGGNPCGQANPNTVGQPVREALAKWNLTLVTGGVGPTASPTSSPPPGGSRTFANETDLPITDFQRTVSPVRSTATGRAVSPVRVAVSIRHTCAEDLGVSLISPTGFAYPVKYSGGYTCSPWSGERRYQVPVQSAAAGTWQLRITDYGPGDTGTLDRWSLTL